MEQSYTEKKNRVIETIADMGRMTDVIPFDGLKQQLGMSDIELSRFCNGLNEDGLIWFGGGDVIQVKDKFYRSLEKSSPPTHSGHFTLYVTNNYGTIQQGFSNSLINQSVDDIVPKLTEFIESVKELDFDRRDRVLEDLEEIKTLAQGNLNPNIWELIQAKLLSAEAGLKIAGVVYSSHPYWPAISEFFRQAFK